MEYFWFLCLVLLSVLVLVGLSAILAFLFPSGMTVVHDPELMDNLASELRAYEHLESDFQRKAKWLSEFSLPVPELDANDGHTIEELWANLDSVFRSQLNQQHLKAIAPNQLKLLGKVSSAEALCILRNAIRRQAPKARKKIYRAWKAASNLPDFNSASIFFWRILHHESQGEDRASRQLQECLTENLTALITDKFFAENIFRRVKKGNSYNPAHQTKQKNGHDSDFEPWLVAGFTAGVSLYAFESMSETSEPSPASGSEPVDQGESVEGSGSPDEAIETGSAEAADFAADPGIEDIFDPLGALSLVTLVLVVDKQGTLYGAGKIDGKEAMINAGIQLGSKATAVAIGAGIGAAAGSVIPVIGTAIGGWLGGMVGGIIGNGVARKWQKERYYWVKNKFEQKGGEIKEANREYYKSIQSYLRRLQRDFSLKLTSLKWKRRERPFAALACLESALRYDLDKAKNWKARHQQNKQSIQYRKISDFISYGEKLAREIQSGEPGAIIRLMEQFRNMPMLKYGKLFGTRRRIRKIREREHADILVGLMGWIYGILNLHGQVLMEAVRENNFHTHILGRQQEARKNELEALRRKKDQRKAQFSKV